MMKNVYSFTLIEGEKLKCMGGEHYINCLESVRCYSPDDNTLMFYCEKCWEKVTSSRKEMTQRGMSK